MKFAIFVVPFTTLILNELMVLWKFGKQGNFKAVSNTVASFFLRDTRYGRI